MIQLGKISTRLLMLYSLACCIAFASCVDDDMIAPTPEPVALDCEFEFEPNEAGDACVCPPGKIQQDTILCYTLPEGYWYADMAGCNWPIGMSFGPESGSSQVDFNFLDSTTAWTYYEATDRYHYLSEVIWPVRIGNNPRLRTVPLQVYLETRDGENYDFITLSIEDSNGWTMPGLPYERELVRLSFEGRPVSEDSLVGTFYFGYDRFEAPYDFISLYECEGVFVRNGG